MGGVATHSPRFSWVNAHKQRKMSWIRMDDQDSNAAARGLRLSLFV